MALALTLALAPGGGGLVITEVNPDHDPDGQLIKTLVEVVAQALVA